MKLSVVLWGCCQEQQSKIEHLEASMYEMMEDIKEFKGKKTTKLNLKRRQRVKQKLKNDYIKKFPYKYLIWYFKSTIVMTILLWNVDDLDIKDELIKIKRKLLNEMKKMDTNFKNIKCVITNNSYIANDANAVDTLRGANFRFIDDKDILKTFENAFNKRLDESLEWQSQTLKSLRENIRT